MLTDTLDAEGSKMEKERSGTKLMFFKTRMCISFLDGHCPNGNNCSFAHGVHELREPAANWQELVRGSVKGARGWSDDLIHRKHICRNFYYGQKCHYGETCKFLHERPPPTPKYEHTSEDTEATELKSELPVPRRQVEAKVRLNIRLNPTKAVLLPVNGAAASSSNGGPTQVAETKNLLKWKDNRRITGIYADWLEGYIPPEDLPNQMHYQE